MLSEAARVGEAANQSEAYFVIDEQQRIVQWSNAAAAILATSADSALGEPCYAVLRGCDPFGRTVCRPGCHAIEAIRAGHARARCTFTVERRAAAPRFRCELHALPRSTGGAIALLSKRAIAGEPINAPEPDETSAPPAADLLGDLSALAMLATSLSPGNVLDRLDEVLDLVREVTGAESAELFLQEPVGGDLLLTAYRGPFQRAFGQIVRFAPGQGFPGLAAHSRQPVLTANLRQDKRYLRDQVREKGYRSYLCMPLCAEAAFGAICVGSREIDVCAEALRFLTWASAPIATALRAGLLQANRAATPEQIQFRGDDGDLDRLLRETLRRVRLVARADGGTLVLHTRPTAGLVGRVTDGVLAAPTCPYLDQVGAAASCPVLAGGHGVALYGPRHSWPPACQHLRRHGSVTYCLPLPVDDKEIGIIHLAYRDSPPSPPTRHLGVLLQATTQTASTVRTARGYFEQRHLAATQPPWLLQSEAQSAMPGMLRHEGDERSPDMTAGSATAAKPCLHIRCFGSFELQREGVLVGPEMFKRRQALTLLKILLMHAGHPVLKDTLIECLWPESDPQTAVRRLHVVVHALREVIELDRSSGRWVVIRSDPDGYAFDPSVPYWFDVREFRVAIEKGRSAEERGAATAAVDAYDAAIRLYRGDFCEDDRFAEWCWLEREQLRETYLDTLQRLAAVCSELGEPERAIHRYRQVLRTDPLRETVQHRLIECLWAAGRRAEALQQYEQFRHLLRQELDIAPSAEIETLIQRIRLTPTR